MGAFRFEPISLAPGGRADYIVLLGTEESEERISRIFEKYNTSEKVLHALEDTKACWQDQVSVRFRTGDADFDCLMKWICFQPFLRRLFGCSFLPHHDYGRGGRGWRDLWQDCLSLLLMEPDQVGKMIAERAAAKGIETVVFDRGGYIFHGRVKELAEGAREGGLSF